MVEPAERENQELEPALDVEISPMMEPASALVCNVTLAGVTPPKYWQAQKLASAIHREVEAMQGKGDRESMRRLFFVLGHYYGRTMGILRSALADGREPLINTALLNLVALHQPMHHMHEVAPGDVPFVLTLNRETRQQVFEDIIVKVLEESPEPLELGDVTSRVSNMNILLDASDRIVARRLENLIARGYVQSKESTYSRTKRAYSSLNLDRASLQAFLGQKLYQEFERGGFQALSSIVNRKDAFKEFFSRFAGCGTQMAERFIAAAVELIGSPSQERQLTPWRYNDLIGSLYPRPYQLEAYAIFRGYGYQGQLIEAPTGSGKTMIGMMCIQDWLRTISHGESILVLVPTVNYEQQWVGELCYKQIGLQITPDAIFTGTPAALEEERRRTGFAPAIMVMTYTSLAQLGSPDGKGGFDQISVERFLQGSNIRYVVLDEVHRVADDLTSVSAGVARLLTNWLRDGSLQGLVGFSGTAAAFRERFKDLGLQLVYVMPAADLIAYGFVAPFGEFGIPFTYSDREKQVRELLEQYKAAMNEFVALVGSDRIREWGAAITIEERVQIGRDILGVYADRENRGEALKNRYLELEHGGTLSLNDLALIATIQIAGNLSDTALLEKALAGIPEGDQKTKREHFQKILIRLNKIREGIKRRLYFPDIVQRLSIADFGLAFNADSIRQLPNEMTSRSAYSEHIKDVLASSIVGLYTGLRSIYYRVGEGRVDTIKAIIEAERATRGVSGVIIFDSAKRIQWENDGAISGFAGVGGLFSEMIGDKRFTPMAVISSEIYMPWDATSPLPNQIADYIHKDIMTTELGEALFGLVTQGLPIAEPQLTGLRNNYWDIFREYVQSLYKVRTARPGEFNRKVLRKLRRTVSKATVGASAAELRARLSPKNHHIHRLVGTFFDYALIATQFLEANTAELRQASGALRKFFVVKMAGEERKPLMYDLTARIVDDERFPINVIIVSLWARTGWNVIKPNILIDATATRNVTAWQQLRGRAMRAARTWDKDCYELGMALLGSYGRGVERGAGGLPRDVLSTEKSLQKNLATDILDERSKQLLVDVHRKASTAVQSGAPSGEDTILPKIGDGRLTDFTEKERARLAIELMLDRNKVTHIYELIKAYGSGTQVVFNRKLGAWQRTPSIALKHAHEYSVSPISGHYGVGEVHAPLIYTDDPRKNLPSQLRKHLSEELRDRDPAIVEGWIKAVVSPAKKGIGPY
jgi:superfamily II DNA or RNA helicase